MTTTQKAIFGEPETVEVRIDDEGRKSFWFSSREGWEDLGPVIQMAADTYAVGTIITLKEPIE